MRTDDVRSVHYAPHTGLTAGRAAQGNAYHTNTHNESPEFS